MVKLLIVSIWWWCLLLHSVMCSVSKNKQWGQIMRPNMLNPLSQHQAPDLPRVYESSPDEWGCCRLCLHREVPAQYKKTWKPADPARSVNCCPLCPWPRKQKRRLGPYTYYFSPKKSTERQHYEADLDTFKPYLQREAMDVTKKGAASPQQQRQSGEGEAAFVELSHTVLPSPDPYKFDRGDLMDRENNYLYGFPGEPANVDVTPKPDAPPCCNICRMEKKYHHLVDDQTCCMQCANNVVGQWRRYTSRRLISQSTVLGIPPKTRSSRHGPIDHTYDDGGIPSNMDAAPVPKTGGERAHIHNVITGQPPPGGFDPHTYHAMPWP